MAYLLDVPQFDIVSISPNPISANGSYLISVVVSEVTLVVDAVAVYCGALICGEEGEIF